jgi:peptidoglycan L-alanyl-D-glutamate endopeptidase CwlK
MSERLFADDVLFLQRLLKSAGLYLGKLDGDWGPKTDAAADAFEEQYRQLQDSLGEFPPRSEARIQTLHPKAQKAARIFLRKVLDAGLNVRILSGTRTYAEQNALFRIGRFGDTRSKVTNARGGQSNHNFGIAWDIGIFDDDGRYLPDSPLYREAADAGLVDGLEWGGNWISFKDTPHYQLATGLSISEVRAKFENGEPYV